MKRILLGLLLLVPALSVTAQHQHPATGDATAAQAPEAAHHAFLDMERQAIERGEGFGMALPADKAGYPGPKHALDLKAELKLTPDQIAAMEKLYAAMKQKAIERGREVLAAEQRLDEMFREGRPEPELREESYRVASLRVELRWVHLGAHLAARKLLTPEQIATYMRLRHGQMDHAHAH